MTARDKCPAHYCFSDLQPWDVIDAWGLDYYLGNVLKYICRAGRKSPEKLVDLNKALHYLQKEIELAERALAESRAFSRTTEEATEDTMEENTEDTTEDNIPSWDTEPWPELTCPICGKNMVVWRWDEENDVLEYRCACGSTADTLWVRLNEVPERCPYCGSENTSNGNGDHVCLDCRRWWEEEDD